jgi:uncharacterized protein YecE (DUF72 family)
MAVNLQALEQLRASLPDLIHLGTSSWTYPGWRDLVYSQDYPKTGAGHRMLEEYARFPLFRTVGIDSTFYRPPTENTLRRYADALSPGFPCLSKVWDRITIHSHSEPRNPGHAGERNPDFLNADRFLAEVLDPYLTHFGDHLGPFIFEFQAVHRDDRMTPQRFADRLDDFFNRLPTAARYAVEVRNAEFLHPAYFAVLREHGVGHVFNSWTRMPSIGKQLALADSLTAPFIVARALLRPGRAYQAAVDSFAPYDRVQDVNPEMRGDLVRLIETGLDARIPAYLLVNNRAEGSAPHTIAAVAEMAVSRLAQRTTGEGAVAPSPVPGSVSTDR